MQFKYHTKLNPAKCTFSMESGKLLRFIISKGGSRPSKKKKKTQAIIDMKSPKNLHEVLKSTGRVMTLNWFVLKSTGKCLPFLHVLRKTQEWEKKCEEVFE